MVNFKKNICLSLALASGIFSSEILPGGTASKVTDAFSRWYWGDLSKKEIMTAEQLSQKLLTDDFDTAVAFLNKYESNPQHIDPQAFKTYLIKKNLIQLLQVIRGDGLSETINKVAQFGESEIDDDEEFEKLPIDDSKAVANFKFNNAVSSAAFSADNVNFVGTSMTGNTEIIAYNVTHQTYYDVSTSFGCPDSIAFNPTDHNMFAIGSRSMKARRDGHEEVSTIHLCDLATKKSLPFSVGNSMITALVFSPDGHFLYAAVGSQVLLFDLQNKNNPGIPLISLDDYISALTLMNDGKLLIGTKNHNTVELWDLARNNERPMNIFDCNAAVADIPNVPESMGAFNARSISSISVSSNNQSVFITSTNYCTFLWDIESNDFSVLFGPTDESEGTCSAFSKNPQFAASGYYQNSALLWDLETRSAIKLVPPLPDGTAPDNLPLILTLNFNEDCSGIYLVQKFHEYLTMYYVDFNEILGHLSLPQIYFLLKMYQLVCTEHQVVDPKAQPYREIFKSFDEEHEQGYIRTFCANPATDN